MELFIELLFFVLKAAALLLMVYWFVSTLQDKQLKSQQDLALLKSRPRGDSGIVQQRIQAYERLILMCDRLSLSKLIRRIKVDGMSAHDFKLALYVAIAQEYDHNITQQIYVTDKLWDILRLSRNQMMALIEDAYESLADTASSSDLEYAIYDKVGEISGEPAMVARQGVATEARWILGI